MPVQTPQPSSAFPTARQNYHLGQCVTDIDDRNRPATCWNYRAAGNGAAYARDPIGLAELVGGLVVFVHHAGKSRSAGLRGHSSLNAAMDTVIEVTKDAASRSWHLAKAKDDSSDVWRPFELKAYEVDRDAYGPVTSCAVVQTVTPGPVAAKRPPTGRNQIAALTALSTALATPGATMTFANACHVVAAALPPATKRAPERAREVVNSLIKSHHLVRDDQDQLHLS